MTATKQKETKGKCLLIVIHVRLKKGELHCICISGQKTPLFSLKHYVGCHLAMTVMLVLAIQNQYINLT